jgi:type IV pilus assembly protein PilX
MSRGAPGAARGQGFTLVTILLMMSVLAFLALGAMKVSVLQERMAGHARDRNIALQAAEAALRDAEADVLANVDSSAAFSSACTKGLCTAPSLVSTGASSKPIWQTLPWDAAHTRQYGQYTGASALPVVAQPSYIVELLPNLPPEAGSSANLASQLPQESQVFRITVRAVGLRASTQVMLQSIYVKR